MTAAVIGAYWTKIPLASRAASITCCSSVAWARVSSMPSREVTSCSCSKLSLSLSTMVIRIDSPSPHVVGAAESTAPWPLSSYWIHDTVLRDAGRSGSAGRPCAAPEVRIHELPVPRRAGHTTARRLGQCLHHRRGDLTGEVRGPAQCMGRQDDVLHREQRVVLRRRFWVEDVQGRPGDPPLL